MDIFEGFEWFYIYKAYEVQQLNVYTCLKKLKVLRLLLRVKV